MTIREIPIPVKITIKMSSEDFEYLYETSMNWEGPEWAAQDGRFVPMPSYKQWQRAYWFDSFVNLMLAKSYLDHFETRYEVVNDENAGQFVLLTNYGGPLFV
jgi:hypothetical protein